MKRSSALVRSAVLLAAGLAVSGCISLFPKTKPAHLYRFGQTAVAAADAAPSPAPADQVGVYRAHGLFQREAAGDRLLTITGGRAAYVAQTRWVAPAQVLWDEAVLNAFDVDPGHARLILRGEQSGSAAYILRLDVRNFETRYDRGAKAAPTVTVRVRATITRANDQTLVSERIFEKRVAAGDNRVSAIVPAYDQAVGEVLAELVAWTNEEAKPA